MAKVKQKFTATRTTCESCAAIIKRQAMKVNGVKDITFDYKTETGTVTYNNKKTNLKEIFSRIEEKGYSCSTSSKKSNGALGWIFGIIGFVIVIYFILRLTEGIALPTISQNMGYSLLFIVGLLTGFHCIAMCGGFVVSYTAKDAQEGRKSHLSHLKYGIGKTLSYTIIGAIFGLVGSVIAFTPTLRGVVGIIAGLFLALFGLKMLNIIPFLRNIQFRTPKFIARFVGKEQGKSSNPLVIGLLNGLMIACGPLQAIYIMAAGTGSMIEGAKLLFVFGLGTLPAMLGFGYVASYISNKATQKILKASGTIVIILGLLMVNNGLALTGSGYDFKSLTTSTNIAAAANNGVSNVQSDKIAVIKNGYQEIHMTVSRYGYSPNIFFLKKGVPVKWIIDGQELTSCNRAIIVQSLGLSFQIKPGVQTIEFTPADEGTIRWSCWMGMLQGAFVVKNDISDTSSIQNQVSSAPAQRQMTCGGSGGGCGCGG